MRKTALIGKIFYGSLFMLFIPFILIAWAWATEPFITLPTLHFRTFGLAATAFGLFLILRGMLDLWIYGQGLPMNAFPPKKFVTQGVYKYLSHPIYVGSGIISIGLSLYSGSASGLWLVSPIFILGMFALVLGYEKDAIDTLFKPKDYHPLIALPPNTDTQPTSWQRWSFLIIVLIPWFILYELITLMGAHKQSLETYLPFEYNLPVLGITEVFYALAYPFTAILPFLIKKTTTLRKATIAGLLMTITGLLLQFFLPLSATFKQLNPEDAFNHLLNFEREWSSAAGAFPSFHVAWAFFAAHYYAISWPKWKTTVQVIAIIISLSCITTGMHSIIDVVAGWLLYRFAINYPEIWLFIKKTTETIANSYKEWYFGPLRIINHALYPGIAGFIGLFMISIMTNQPVATFIIGLCSLIGAALWAQFIEGSAKLSRPFGYFGSILGGLIAIYFITPQFKMDVWLMLSAFTTAAPWVQGSGRFRCWVQGCCHGKKTNAELGICYHHPRSRVLVLSHMGDTPLHNTQLYSVLSCFIIGLILVSLWYAEVSVPMLSGLYFILTGLSRFVEEHYRGEPQTPIYYGLRLYQWLAILFVAFGMYLSTFTYQTAKPEFTQYNQTLILSPVFGLICAFLMGMDFPYSTKRFSRLASVD